MFSILKDERVNCFSLLVEMRLSAYLSLVERSYEDAGGIEGQRAPLKTKTAVTIRNRLVQDIKSGAVVPPIVLGVLLPLNDYRRISHSSTEDEILELIHQAGPERVSVIDGMQRTTAMLEATKSDASSGDRIIRVEFWMADKVSSLIYRMLVLNTGQVPWEIGRQLETVYGQFLVQIRDQLGVGIEIFKLDERRRRVQPGQYQSKNIIELLLLFSSRKSELDIRDRVAEDFARLDAIETTSHTEFIDYFVTSLQVMSEIDQQFSRADEVQDENDRLKTGKDVFSSFPAMAGFISAVSVELFDEPGFRIDWDKAKERLQQIEKSLMSLVQRMKDMTKEELTAFIQLQLLEERLSQRSGQVGRFERELFRRAFSSMIRNAERLVSLEPCWMA